MRIKSTHLLRGMGFTFQEAFPVSNCFSGRKKLPGIGAERRISPHRGGGVSLRSARASNRSFNGTLPRTIASSGASPNCQISKGFRFGPFLPISPLVRFACGSSAFSSPPRPPCVWMAETGSSRAPLEVGKTLLREACLPSGHRFAVSAILPPSIPKWVSGEFLWPQLDPPSPMLGSSFLRKQTATTCPFFRR